MKHFHNKHKMKNTYLILLLAIGLLTGTAATVKAEEKPVTKPDTTVHTTPIKVYRLSDGLWNYSEAQLCAAAHAAIPTLTFIARKWESPAPGIYWLRFWAKETSTGKFTNVYFHLELNGDWYEIPVLGGGWPAPRCAGDCLVLEDVVIDLWDPAICSNKGTTAMVKCECSGTNGGSGTDYTRCWFLQYPASDVESFFNTLKEMPPVEQ